VLGRPDDGGERHVALVVDADQVLRGDVVELGEQVEEALVHVLLRHPVEELLERAEVARAGRPDAHLAAVAQTHVALLAHGVGRLPAQLLSLADQAELARGRVQVGAVVGVRYFDQVDCPLAERAAEQVGDAVLADDPMDVAARDRDGLARRELRADRGLSAGRPRREADDRLAAL
jgi:hypothetical protein